MSKSNSVLRLYIEALTKALSTQDSEFLISSLVDILLERIDLDNPDDQQMMINTIKESSGIVMPNKTTLAYILNGEARNSYSDIKALIESIHLHCKVKGWDGAEAEPVSEETIQNTNKFISCIERFILSKQDVPVVVPSASGGICFYWALEADGYAVEFRQHEIEWDLRIDGRGSEATIEVDDGLEASVLGRLTDMVSMVTNETFVH